MADTTSIAPQKKLCFHFLYFVLYFYGNCVTINLVRCSLPTLDVISREAACSCAQDQATIPAKNRETVSNRAYPPPPSPLVNIEWRRGGVAKEFDPDSVAATVVNLKKQLNDFSIMISFRIDVLFSKRQSQAN